ncbi:MAG: YcgL domain-containing protein [Halioglobus sp.]|nr:YcgL domain-containing protein [Halioglobus sp.]
MTLLCQVFKSSRKSGMYLYVDHARGLSDVPPSLMQRFGAAEPVMTLLLDPQRKLARARATDVLAGIAEQGYYLQMPPPAAGGAVCGGRPG